MNNVEFKIMKDDNEEFVIIDSDKIVKSFLDQNPDLTCEKISELSDDEIIETIYNDNNLFESIFGVDYTGEFKIEFV